MITRGHGTEGDQLTLQTRCITLGYIRILFHRHRGVIGFDGIATVVTMHAPVLLRGSCCYTMGVALTVCNLGLLQYCISARLHVLLALLPRSMETDR